MLLTESDKAIIKRTWDLVVPLGETVADLFYRRLFEIAPQYRSLFQEDMDKQKGKLVAMLAFIVQSLDWPAEAWQDAVDVEQDLFMVVLALGRRHRELYNVPDEGYGAVGEALLWTLDYGLGEAFTEETKTAWANVYTLIARAMKMGASSIGTGSVVEQKVNNG